MRGEIVTALALVLVIEGLLPAISPSSYKRTVETFSRLPDGTIRYVGLGLMAVGALLLYLIR